MIQAGGWPASLNSFCNGGGGNVKQVIVSGARAETKGLEHGSRSGKKVSRLVASWSQYGGEPTLVRYDSRLKKRMTACARGSLACICRVAETPRTIDGLHLNRIQASMEALAELPWVPPAVAVECGLGGATVIHTRCRRWTR